MDLGETLTAARALAALPGHARARLLSDLAAALGRREIRAAVFAANEEDMTEARKEQAAGRLGPALVARLGLDDRKLDGLAAGLRQLAAMPDLVGRVTLRRELDEGLVLQRVSCPLGVLGVVFEARPEALVQIAGLAWKSGNAVVLKGGREARASNLALAGVARDVLDSHGIGKNGLFLLEDRAQVQALLERDDVIALMIARGSAEFVRHVRASSRIPVLAHAEGVCHLYLHAAADPAMAARLAVDGKCSYPAACNATETLLWDEGAARALDACVAALAGHGVVLRGCPETRSRHPAVLAATQEDFRIEHSALVLSVRKVSGLDGAMEHIARYGSRHTDAIVTQDPAAADRFLAEVDAACVFHNASTRFADGYRFGLGAEVGISTDKLHARGPVGVEGLLTYRWLLEGRGQATTDYGPGGRSFAHRDLPTGS